jgi:hypothetical protein
VLQIVVEIVPSIVMGVVAGAHGLVVLIALVLVRSPVMNNVKELAGEYALPPVRFFPALAAVYKVVMQYVNMAVARIVLAVAAKVAV